MKIKLILLTTILSFSIAPTQAGDLEAGRKKAETCAACHGAVGISTNTAWPNLAGQKQAYLAKQMKDFREGRRTDSWMSPMAKALSNEDIDDLATFFNSLPIRDEYQ